jgi:hypothetical protein
LRCRSGGAKADGTEMIEEKVVKRGVALIFAQVIENIAKINVQSMSLLAYAICYN